MKNKGFTLVELLATISILALIALITIPTISSLINSSKNSLYDTQVKNIISAAKIWASDNVMYVPNDSNSDVTIYYEEMENAPENYKRLIITLKVLQDGGYIGKDIKNNKTGQNFDENMKIYITKVEGRLEYSLDENLS